MLYAALHWTQWPSRSVIVVSSAEAPRGADCAGGGLLSSQRVDDSLGFPRSLRALKSSFFVCPGDESHPHCKNNDVLCVLRSSVVESTIRNRNVSATPRLDNRPDRRDLHRAVAGPSAAGAARAP